MRITVKNCNNIKEANVEIKERELNIKFGPNGTGKTTISNAILSYSLNDNERLQKLLPYDAEEGVVIPTVEGVSDKKIRVFDESYMESYLFKGDNFFENSFQIFLRSEETDKFSKNISDALEDLQKMFKSDDKIQRLREFLPTFFDTVKTADDENKTVRKTGGIKEFISGNGAGFEKYSLIDSYKRFYSGRDMFSVTKWANWRNEGSKEIIDNHCPFCTKELDSNISSENEIIGKVFKKSALSSANAILSYLNEAVERKYITQDAVKKFEMYIGNQSKTDELYAELQQLTTETHYLWSKINKICDFRPMNVSSEQLVDIDKKLEEMRIESRLLTSYYNTEFVLNFIKMISDRIDDLKNNTGKLKGLFNQLEGKLKKIINEREEDINDFFALAGFPYYFKLTKDGENRAIAFLSPVINNDLRINEPKSHLSWGERNAFALVMFMFEAISDNTDLIVLDDPISSFDNNKKYAIIRRLFDGKKISFKDKTVVMFTHDMQPIIDYVHVSPTINSTRVNAVLIQNNNGEIIERKIEKSDLINVVTLTEKIAHDSENSLPTRVVNIRKFIEITNSEPTTLPIYEVLSNIIHGRDKDKMTNIDKEELSSEVFEEGMSKLNDFIEDADYEEMLTELSDTNLKKIIDADDLYDKIIALRILLERHEDWFKELRRKEPGLCKFLNESNHIENDYIFQLNPKEFFHIPSYYISIINDFIRIH